MKVVSSRACYGVLQSTSPVCPQQHIPGFFPCLLPAVRPALLFGAATRDDKTHLSAGVGRGLPAPAQHGGAGPIPQGKGLPRLVLPHQVTGELGVKANTSKLS